MKLKAYTIFDSATATYARPYFTQSDGAATRSFSDICLDKDHPVGQHPEDYTLYRIGEFDDEKGIMTADTQTKLATGPELIAIAQNINHQKVAQLNEQIKAGGSIS